MAEGLCERLIGAWKLVSYQEIPVDGSEPFEPLGHEPQGLIMYTPGGYMSGSWGSEQTTARSHRN
ncbi:lipocalin-like domain-containing protein [Streptomyces sp. NRRL S-813]|uniref:lipocalin-like domain-containing protein n=1 Tax=Streptomyces sp. NRRL S-813 TaxID=1463919 RepID=UPI0004BEA8A2|nr:lipocalin-like domain-containing protein [Streptomyces sp. NRRL S-813]